ncbi:MAG: hypothetical protein UY92_C0021G0002 [Candidatus Magasanikbacteria bacterium GW2011_GWA2_56_11]|uniref:Uncharacterized protein n=1 Tax=Candidatus Magasanikbacteria bacterium GW2011_GWA2_56_11 TaxID=1619044 RepID=A0A0G1YCW6_9BACT|nr:MAG: hypothetical protein UY92_C0021G0002 [Candidatus Magasanikbacteria bacterium GW2011_GWA2_56_11]
MYNSKKFKILWTVISLIAVAAMVFFTILPAFY